MKPKHLLVLLFLVAAFSWGSLLSGKFILHPLAEPPSKDRIVWERSFKGSLRKAKARHEMVFIDFYADWCGYCKEMDRTTYKNPNLVRLSHRFVCTRIDVEKNERLARDFHVDGLPTLVFVNAQASEVKRVEGYVPPPNLIAAMLSLLRSRQPGQE